MENNKQYVGIFKYLFFCSASAQQGLHIRLVDEKSMIDGGVISWCETHNSRSSTFSFKDKVKEKQTKQNKKTKIKQKSWFKQLKIFSFKIQNCEVTNWLC